MPRPRSRSWFFIAWLSGGLAACIPDDWDGSPVDSDPASPDTDEPWDTSVEAEDPELVGTWRSDGANRSPLFARLGIAWVEASFRPDGTYTVTSQDKDGQRGTFEGDWIVVTGTEPRGITLEQQTPYAGRAEGLYAVRGTTLTLETVQTLPDYGNQPPQGDFGTSRGTGLSAGDNVQTYVRR